MPMSIDEGRRIVRTLEAELARGIVGQKGLIRGLLVGLIADGHVLIEGVPGLAKTRAVNLLARACRLQFKRIQFTPDLLPADVVGTRIYNQAAGTFETVHGPVFANVVLADEINRAPAKVQSALLETMQERQVTIAAESVPVPSPFLVFATQNPIEQEGTYPLPEAQLDRFLLKLEVGYPTPEDERAIVRMVIGESALPEPETTVGHDEVVALQAAAREVFVEPQVIAYATTLVNATRPRTEGRDADQDRVRWVELGASPRASISLILAARATALIEGREAVLPDDVKAVAHAVLRHRILRTYVAEAERVTANQIIDRILASVPVP